MNMFAKAKKAATAPTKEIVQIPGLHQLVCLKTFIRDLQGHAAAREVQVKQHLSEYFIDTGMALKHQPENFTGEDRDATASCQLRKRSKSIPLQEEDVVLLREAGITALAEETQEERYILNSTYTQSPTFLRKLHKILAKVPDLPEDLFIYEPESKVTVATDKTIEEVFARVADKTGIKTLLPKVSSLTVTPNATSVTLPIAIKTVGSLYKRPKTPANAS